MKGSVTFKQLIKIRDLLNSFSLEHPNNSLKSLHLIKKTKNKTKGGGGGLEFCQEITRETTFNILVKVNVSFIVEYAIHP